MIGELLARLQATQSETEQDWVIMEFSLASLNPTVQEAVWAAAIAHWFDVTFLAALLDQPVVEVQPVFDQSIRLSYVEHFPNRGYNIHERSRALLLDRLWNNNLALDRELSRHAA